MAADDQYDAVLPGVRESDCQRHPRGDPRTFAAFTLFRGRLRQSQPYAAAYHDPITAGHPPQRRQTDPLRA